MTLTAAEMTQARADAEELLPSTCTIKVRSTTSDGYGGVSETWADTDNVPCRLDNVEMQARMEASGDKVTVHDAWTLFVHWDRSIAAGNRVVFDSDTYEVMSVQDDHDWRLLREATLRRVNA